MCEFRWRRSFKDLLMVRLWSIYPMFAASQLTKIVCAPQAEHPNAGSGLRGGFQRPAGGHAAVLHVHRLHGARGDIPVRSVIDVMVESRNKAALDMNPVSRLTVLSVVWVWPWKEGPSQGSRVWDRISAGLIPGSHYTLP